MAELVRLEAITKTFPGVKALDGVSLSVSAGECLALVGENGAGKSTLMNVLSGTYPAGSYAGRIFVDGRDASFRSPLDAERAGIAIIHQELSGFPHLTVAENLCAGHWPRRHGLVDWKAIHENATRWLGLLGHPCLPSDVLGELPVGTQQLVEIAKALSRQCRVLILDEPTSALTPRETAFLFDRLRELRAQGHGLIYISHKMEEIYALADRITVLRDGKSVHTAPAAELPQAALVSHMVGRPLDRIFPAPPARELGRTALRARNLSATRRDGKRVLESVSFAVRQGEILGIAGLLGAGRSELLQTIFGDPALRREGELELHDQAWSARSPRAAWRSKLAWVGEDRKRDSLLPTRSLAENSALARLAAGSLASALSPEAETAHTERSLRELRTRMTGVQQLITELSGGNQQKVVFSRALQTAPEVILLDEPTRGIDVGAKLEIYELLFALARQGKALLVVSSDLPELMALADRILVLSAGRITGELERAQFSQTAIMELAVKGQAK